MAERRRYTKREKAVAVTAALASSVKAAAEETGVPRTTLIYWMESPAFDTLRQKTRDDMAKGFEVLAHRSQGLLMEKLPDMEPRDLIILLGVATDKAQLLSGHATSRSETKALTNGLDDHEKDALRAILRGAIAADESALGSEAADAGRAGAEVREPSAGSVL